MPTGKKIKKDAKKEAARVAVATGEDIGGVFDALEEEAPLLESPIPAELPGTADEPDQDEDEEEVKLSSGFRRLQEELALIRDERATLSTDMKAPGLDKDERDTLKGRSSLLDAREKSVRADLKTFHKNELSELGQVRKIRIIVEDRTRVSGEITTVQGAL